MSDSIVDITQGIPVIPQNLIDALNEAALESSFRSSGAGSFSSIWQTVTSRIDRFSYNPMPPNHEVAGLTFITRPKLNLRTTSLRHDRIMSTLDTVDPISLPFSIRCYLDSNFSKWNLVQNLVQNSPFVNSDVPFIVPLGNTLHSIDGWPSFSVDSETTTGGFYGEDQTFARGSDMNMRSYDFTLTFRDFQGGYIMALFLYWVRYIALVTRGMMTAYPEDIYARRLCYTCSIYRFVLDPSRRFITKWAKATGCYPNSVPIGNCFDIGERESYLHASERFSIPFTVNNVEMMDPIIFQDFNTIVSRYCNVFGDERTATTVTGENNFAGVPYIDTVSGTNELKFMALPEELENPTDTIMRQIRNQVMAQTATSSIPNAATVTA